MNCPVRLDQLLRHIHQLAAQFGKDIAEPAYPPKPSVIADIPAQRPSARSGHQLIVHSIGYRATKPPQSAALTQISRPSMWARRGLWDRERHRLPALRAPIEYVVFGVDQLDKHLVLTGQQTRHADCIVVTRSCRKRISCHGRLVHPES
jgi:hypothetical protein